MDGPSRRKIRLTISYQKLDQSVLFVCFLADASQLSATTSQKKCRLGLRSVCGIDISLSTQPRARPNHSTNITTASDAASAGSISALHSRPSLNSLVPKHAALCDAEDLHEGLDSLTVPRRAMPANRSTESSIPGARTRKRLQRFPAAVSIPRQFHTATRRVRSHRTVPQLLAGELPLIEYRLCDSQVWLFWRFVSSVRAPMPIMPPKPTLKDG